METKEYKNKPYLKTKGLSNYHIELFSQILLNKTFRKIGIEYGYTAQSHSVIDHCRKVMHKLMALEGLSRADHYEQIKYPRKYLYWWRGLLDNHKDKLYELAIEGKFYSKNNCDITA